MEKRILIVEDNRETAFVLSEYFEDYGFSPEVATTGKEAIAKFINGNFKLLLTDYKLPDMNGHSIVKKFREDNPDLKVVYLTAFNLSHKISIDSNTQILEKPCKPQEILNAITKILK